MTISAGFPYYAKDVPKGNRKELEIYLYTANERRVKGINNIARDGRSIERIPTWFCPTVFSLVTAG
jgi:hypothetical protein